MHTYRRLLAMGILTAVPALLGVCGAKKPAIRSAESLYRTACEFYSAKHVFSAQVLLLEIVRDHAETPTGSRAMLALADCAAEMQDEAQEIKWLRLCAATRTCCPTNRDLDTNDTRSLAIQRLGSWHERRHEWKEALALWEALEPESWCGTCLMELHQERRMHILRCELQLGNHADVARKALEPYGRALKLLGESSDDEKAGFRIVASVRAQFDILLPLYRGARQLDDLERLLGDLEKAATSAQEVKKRDYAEYLLRTTGEMRKPLQIARLGENRNVRELYALAKTNRWTIGGPRLRTDDLDPVARNILGALGECGGSEVELARTLMAGNHHVRRQGLCTLGYSRSPQALPYLLELLGNAEQPADQEEILAAIGLQGYAGRQELRRMSQESPPPLRDLAKYQLYACRPEVAFHALPAATPGSLPKSLD